MFFFPIFIAFYCFSDWLFSVSNMHLTFLPLISWFDSSFLSSLKHYSIEWLYQGLCIHPPSAGHLDHSQVLAIVKKAAVNIHVQIFMWVCFQLLWINTKDHHCWIVW